MWWRSQLQADLMSFTISSIDMECIVRDWKAKVIALWSVLQKHYDFEQLQGHSVKGMSKIIHWNVLPKHLLWKIYFAENYLVLGNMVAQHMKLHFSCLGYGNKINSGVVYEYVQVYMKITST